MKNFTIYILIAVVFALGCKTRSYKANILPLDSMKVVMFDFLLADEWNNTRKATDSTFEKTKNNLKAYQQVLAIHHITKADFDSSLNYYEQNPKTFKILVDSVNAYGSRIKDNTMSPQTKPLLKKQ